MLAMGIMAKCVCRDIVADLNKRTILIAMPRTNLTSLINKKKASKLRLKILISSNNFVQGRGAM